RRAQEAALAARPYAVELVRVLRSTMARIESPEHPLLAKRPENNVLVIVLTGERGLAGAFNSNVLRKAHEFFRSHKGKKITTIPVGKKGRDALRRAGFTFAAEYVNVLARVDFRTAREIANLVGELYVKEEIDSVYIIFSEFKSVMVPTLAVEKLLPMEAIREDEDDTNKTAQPDREKKKPGEASETPIDYIYEQPEEQILAKLLPRYVETQILRAMLESSAAEHAARMTAMEAATNNANDVIEALTLHMNKVRQAAITKEIIEIVSGASYGA
ncbi:MAG TPA: ATP synthase F1 subunit gamma, partial [Candidatus Eremiobacteraceae bacterium]|nr:ATP synthase F1 subunit gamma [Candidatus Eremiobacteraceae bacterium]